MEDEMYMRTELPKLVASFSGAQKAALASADIDPAHLERRLAIPISLESLSRSPSVKNEISRNS